MEEVFNAMFGVEGARIPVLDHARVCRRVSIRPCRRILPGSIMGLCDGPLSETGEGFMLLGRPSMTALEMRGGPSCYPFHPSTRADRGTI